jgi:hypothetical protein
MLGDGQPDSLACEEVPLHPERFLALRGFPVVVIQQATQPLPLFNDYPED